MQISIVFVDKSGWEKGRWHKVAKESRTRKIGHVVPKVISAMYC